MSGGFEVLLGSDTLMACVFRRLLFFRSLEVKAVNSTCLSPMYRLCSRISLNGWCCCEKIYSVVLFNKVHHFKTGNGGKMGVEGARMSLNYM